MGACGDGESTQPAASADGGVAAVSDGGPKIGADGSSMGLDSSAGSDAAPAVPVGELFAFIGSADGTIRVYSVDDVSGSWTLKKENPGTKASFMAFHPPTRRVVAAVEAASGVVRAFDFDSTTGTLTTTSEQPAGGAGTTHVSFDPSGMWTFAANYTGGSTSVFPIDASGVLGAATDKKASGQKSHWAGTDRAGSHVFVPALGDNVVTQYVFDALLGKLTVNGSASLPAGAGPRHLAFHPSESWVYSMNELAVSVTTFDLSTTSGTLMAKQTVSALPPNESTTNVSGAEIVVHPKGKFVFASTRTYNSVASFAVGGDGKLTRVGNYLTGANKPRSFDIDPEGTLLYAANEDSKQVVGFKIDQTTGQLVSLGEVATPPSPTFVGLARFP